MITHDISIKSPKPKTLEKQVITLYYNTLLFLDISHKGVDSFHALTIATLMPYLRGISREVEGHQIPMSTDRKELSCFVLYVFMYEIVPLEF
jgi:hypothetical protein